MLIEKKNRLCMCDVVCTGGERERERERERGKNIDRNKMLFERKYSSEKINH